MRAINRTVIAATIACTTHGCASTTAPPSFLPSPQQAQTDAYGGWIELQYRGDGRGRRAEGELLAVSADTIWILGDAGGIVIGTATVKQGKLTAYNSRSGAVAGYTTLGVLSTISNGWLLVFSAPLWIITGTVSAANQSHVPERRVPALRWVDLAPFARFPQGLPPGLRLDSLSTKLIREHR